MAVIPPDPGRSPRVRRPPLFGAVLGLAGLGLLLAPAVQAETLVGAQAGAASLIPAVAVRSSPAGGVEPDDAYGCNDDVCIDLTGTGGDITSWTTTGYTSSYVCTYAEYLANGDVVATSEEVCGGPDVQFSSTWSDPGRYASGTRLCNLWPGISGEPCETVG